LILAVTLTALIHFCLFALLNSYAPKPADIDYQITKVQLVTLSPSLPEPTQPPAAEPTLPEPLIEIPPEPLPEEPQPETSPAPPPDNEPSAPPDFIAPEPTQPPPPEFQPPDIQPPNGQSALPLQASPVPEGNVLIPERWRLPVGSRISLDQIEQPKGALEKTLDCLKGFNADCAEQRKSVFAEDQLSETDLVWMASHPHSGLSDSSLFGLSEAEIRDRLGITIAGENGFAILPGLTIDGPLWDKLHGVNKPCTYSLAIGENGQRELRKRCDSHQP